MKSNIDTILKEKNALEVEGHEIHGRIFTTEQLKEKIKQNLLFDKYIYNKKAFWRMFLYMLVNYLFSPLIGLIFMMERFGANYIRNRFRHRHQIFTVIVLPTICFFASVAYLGFKTT